MNNRLIHTDSNQTAEVTESLYSHTYLTIITTEVCKVLAKIEKPAKERKKKKYIYFFI